MNYQILKPDELLTYAEPTTELEIKLLETAQHFSDEYHLAQQIIDDRDHEDLFEKDWKSACDDLKRQITLALAALATGDSVKARQILENI